MDRYIGLDAHASSCTVAVIGTSGRKLQLSLPINPSAPISSDSSPAARTIHVDSVTTSLALRHDSR